MDEKKQKQLKTGAKISLIVLLIYIAVLLISTYQTSYQLDSPLIPKSTAWEVSKQFIFSAFALALVAIIGLVLYFYNRYTWVIILVLLSLIASRFLIPS